MRVNDVEYAEDDRGIWRIVNQNCAFDEIDGQACLDEIAKLRADLDQARRDRNSAVECAEVLRGYVAEHKAALAAARAALDGERGHSDHARRCCEKRWNGSVNAWPDVDALSDWVDAHDARRAAEAKASRGGEGKPCPDCGGTGRSVRYRGLALEPAPCWCQAAAQEPKP